MNIEQERKDFEAWYEKEFPYEPIPIRAAEGYFHRYDNKLWNAYQAGRAALQSQDRVDADRIQFMADEACTFNTWKQEDGSWKYRLEWDHGAEWQTQWFDSPEEAIDHARRAEGDNHE